MKNPRIQKIGFTCLLVLSLASFITLNMMAVEPTIAISENAKMVSETNQLLLPGLNWVKEFVLKIFDCIFLV